jgi:hypothetical protein
MSGPSGSLITGTSVVRAVHLAYSPQGLNVCSKEGRVEDKYVPTGILVVALVRLIDEPLPPAVLFRSSVLHS